VKKKFTIKLICLVLAGLFLVSCAGGIKPDESKDGNEPDISVIDQYAGKKGFDLDKTVYLYEDTRGQMPESLSSVKVIPSESKNGLIPTSAKFVIETKGDIAAAELMEYVSFSPALNYSLKMLSPCSFELSPAEDLTEGRIYRVKLGDSENPVFSFAFQTESRLMVKSVLPANMAYDVPVDAGIEVSFTDVVSGNDFANLVTLAPAVDGTFTLYPDGKTLVFVPKKPLAKNTVYTLTVKEGIKSTSGKVLSEGREVSFLTEKKKVSEPKIKFFVIGRDYLFSPGGENNIPFYANTNKGGEITAEIFCYPSATAAVEAKKEYELVKNNYYGGEEYVYPTGGLEKIGDAKTDWAGGTQNNQGGFLLPDLETGVYIVNLTSHFADGGNKTYQVFVQISNLSLHMESGGKSLLFWVNGKDGPAKGAKLKAEYFDYSNEFFVESSSGGYDTVTGETGDDGVCLMKPGGGNSLFLTVSYGGEEIYTFTSLIRSIYSLSYYSYDYYNSMFGYWYGYRYGGSDRFLSLLYTDREVYFQNDLVNFSGIIKPAASSVPSLKKLYFGVSMGLSSKGGNIGEVSVDENGFFSGSFDIENFLGRGFYLKLFDESGEILLYKYINVTDEEKPVYKAEMRFDKPFYTFGDKVTVSVKASFFDGTPAPGLVFALNEYHFSIQTTMTTGSDGTARYSFYTRPISVSSTYPLSLYFSAYLIGEETTNLNISGGVTYFHSRVYFTAANVSNDYCEAYLNKVDTSKITNETGATYENTIGEKAEGEALVKLIKYEHKKKYVGTTYNPITKKAVYTYEYYVEETLISSAVKQFNDGVIRLETVEVNSDFNGYYLYKVTYYDKDNKHNYECQIYASRRDQYRDYYYYNTSIEPRYMLNTNIQKYSVGDSVRCWVEFGGEKIDEKVLYTIYTAGGVSFVYSDEYISSYEDAFVPGVNVYATVYKNGEIIHLGNVSLNFDYEKCASLDVSVETEKTTFKPGEKTVLTVKGKFGDSPAAGATVVVSVVDEACFALGNQTINALAYYYQSLDYSSISAYVPRMFSFAYSYSYLKELCCDEAGGGELEAPRGNEDQNGNSTSIYLREIFANNPLFVSVELDGEGVGHISFTVPDNITEWRVSAVGFYNQKNGGEKISGTKIGSFVSDIVCTLPYFISISSSEQYIFGDDISVTSRSFGAKLSAGEEITYTATLYDGGGSAITTKKLSVDSGERAAFNFGKLEVGSYSVIVSGVSASGSDAVRQTFFVAETGLLMDISKEIKADEVGSVNPAAYPVYLSFYDSSYKTFLDVAYTLMGGYSERADSAASRYIGGGALQKLLGYNYQLERYKSVISSTINSEGLIPLLVYGEGDIELTAKIVSLAPELIPTGRKETVIAGLSNFISTGKYLDDVQLCAALLGLASLGEPVLADLNYTASHCEGFSVKAKLYLCAAFGYIGDFPTAKSIYGDLLKEYGKESSGELYFDAGNAEETSKLTALALFTASLISRSDAEKMINYLKYRNPYTDFCLLELASYIKHFLPEKLEISTLSYSLGGETKEISLGAGSVYTLILTKKDAESFEVVSASPTVFSRVCYKGSVEEATTGKAAAEEMKITKTISPYDMERGLYLVKITFSGKTDKDYAYFSLSDVIPSGARFYYQFYDRYYNNHESCYAWLNNSGSRMEGGIYVYNSGREAMSGRRNYSFYGSVTYLIRGALAGEYVCERALAINCDDGVYAQSERCTVRIDPWGEWQIVSKSK